MANIGGPYGMAPYGPPPYPMPREHPEATLILVLGLVSLACGPVGFVAWYLGSRAEREIDESGIAYSNAGNIKAGKILGMVMGILTIVGVVLTIGYAIVLLGIFGSLLAGLPHS